MQKINYTVQSYSVNGREGYDMSTALRLWKTKYETDFRDFERDVTPHPSLHDFRDFVKELWDDIKPVTVEEALKLSNTEDRRVYFDAIGVQKLFQQLDPILRDSQTIKKKRARWDDTNTQYEYEFEDVYELYEIEGKKMFETNRWGTAPDPVYAVRCWCTTTNREYWLYVPREAATGARWASDAKEYDAIRAIAWTIRIDVKYPKRIYRQGDIIVVKYDDTVKVNNDISYHLDKDAYLSLMYSET